MDAGNRSTSYSYRSGPSGNINTCLFVHAAQQCIVSICDTEIFNLNLKTGFYIVY